MKNNQNFLNLTAAVLALLVAGVVIYGCVHGADPLHVRVSDGIEQIDLDTIRLPSSGVEVNFSDVILSAPNESRKLIVCRRLKSPPAASSLTTSKKACWPVEISN